MKLSDYTIKEWAEGNYDDTQEYLEGRGYQVSKKFGCSVGFGISLLLWTHEENFDRIYELIVHETAQLIEFYDIADEWQFLLDYLPLVKNHWDGG